AQGVEDCLEAGPDTHGEIWRTNHTGLDGPNTFQLADALPADYKCLVADFDGDGLDEVVVAIPGAPALQFWRSRGDGTFSVDTLAPPTPWTTPHGRWMCGPFVHGKGA